MVTCIRILTSVRCFSFYKFIHSQIVKHMADNCEPVNKRVRIENMNMKIGTHDGTFHCDEVLACFMLKQLPKYKDATIVRTRDESLLKTCDIVVDVGAVYDPQTNRYDHHQREFDKNFNSIKPLKPWKTKLSSAGLVYCHFGGEVLREILKKESQDCDEKTLDVIYDKVYENFVEEVDGIDNGIDAHDGKPKYKISTNLSSRVEKLNPRWNDANPDQMKCFNKAMHMVGTEFLELVDGYLNSWLPARSIVETSLKDRFNVDKSGEIVRLQHYCPWKQHLFQLEGEGKCEVGRIKYVLYSDSSGKWRIQCVPAGKHTFDNRLTMISKWCGIRNEKLSEISGIPGCIFVHANGFIGGNQTYEGVLEMARQCLAQKS